jgi:hypothetical protein
MRLITCHDCARISGSMQLDAFDAMPGRDIWLIDLSVLPPAERSKALADFTPAALRAEIHREAAPTAGTLSESFIADYSVAVIESRLGHSSDPVICLGLTGEDEQLVWADAGTLYSYRWSE